jgi:uncharacterized protein (TIGR03067 family)
MKRFTFSVFVALLFLSTTLTPAAESDQATKEVLKQLSGGWSMVSGSADGQEMPADMLKELKRSYNGNELTVTMAGQIFFKAKISIDPSKKPKTIDYEMIEGPTKGKRQLGVYELDGDTFKSCFAKPDQARPADFKPGDGKTVSVWKRNKPEKK